MKKRVLGMIGIMVSGYSLFLVIHGVYGIRDTIGFYIQYIDGWMWAGINYHMILFLYQLIGTLLELSYGTMGVLCFVFPIKESNCSVHQQINIKFQKVNWAVMSNNKP